MAPILGIVGFCTEAVKLLGPVQEYVAPGGYTPDTVKLSVCSAQMGELEATCGAVGWVETTTASEESRMQPFTLTNTW